MDHSSLEIFCVVAEELSVTRAAQQLGRAQSNVTTRIQQLEEELGVSLFLRDNKQMRLSEQGVTFLVYAKNLLALAEEARQVLHPTEPEGLLRIGSMESTAASRLPTPLAAYHRQWPQVKLRVSTGPSRQLIDALRARTIDCALIALPRASKLDATPSLAEMGLLSRPVFREELMLVLPSDHPPVKRASEIAVPSFAAFRQGCTYREMAENWIEQSMARVDSTFEIQEVGSYHAMLACVAAGASFSFIPRSVIELTPKQKGIHLTSIMEVDTLLTWREGYETPAFQALRNLLDGRKA